MMDSVALNQTLMGPKPGKHLSYWFDAVRKPILIDRRVYLVKL